MTFPGLWKLDGSRIHDDTIRFKCGFSHVQVLHTSTVILLCFIIAKIAVWDALHSSKFWDPFFGGGASGYFTQCAIHTFGLTKQWRPDETYLTLEALAFDSKVRIGAGWFIITSENCAKKTRQERHGTTAL